MSTTRDKPKTFDELKKEFGITIDMLKFDDDVDYLQARFVMAHGTDCCWDKQNNAFIKCGNLRMSAPNAFPLWHKSPSREIIDAEKIVFDPEGKRKDGIINMFTGFAIKPAKGDNTLLLEHLLRMCGDNQEIYDWIVRWIAYPLQNPGAKMATAVVFHGKEGTGKNIFWDTIKDIYGKFGVTISQSQIETEFNAWMSAKLFVLANEVLSRRERRHIKGRLKALITESTIMINQKSMPIRDEENHANFVFLSNENDPIDTDKDDRRYFVVNCEEVFSSRYYQELKDSIDIPALYDYFLTLDLAGFNRHTKPLMTEAKVALLKINARSDQRFIDDWMANETIFPFMSVPSMSLYWAYRCWCEEQGEKFPVSNTAFGRCMSSTNLIKARPSIIGTTNKLSIYAIDSAKASVSRFEFDDFEQILAGEKARYRF